MKALLAIAAVVISSNAVAERWMPLGDPVRRVQWSIDTESIRTEMPKLTAIYRRINKDNDIRTTVIEVNCQARAQTIVATNDFSGRMAQILPNDRETMPIIQDSPVSVAARAFCRNDQ